MSNVTFICIPGKTTTIVVENATSLKDAMEQAGVVAGHELRINGSQVPASTEVHGDTEVVATKPIAGA